MTKENKELLLKDLCARLPYGVMVSVQGGEFDSYKYPYQLTAISKFGLNSLCKVYYPIYTPFGGIPNVENIKPYLRPMSSMTREEWEEYNKIKTGACYFGSSYTYLDMYDWLLAHHFDYRGLIEKGLALEAPKDMYNKNVCSEI